MSLYAEIGGAQILSARIVIPRLGAWYADVTLAAEVQLGGRLTLIAADLALGCVAWRSKPYQGRTRAMVIGGRGGLQKQLPAKGYGASVKLSTVLADVARESGETIAVVDDRAVGDHFVRDVAPAERMLNRLAARWHVALSKDAPSIVVGPWETSQENKPITTAFEVVGFDGAASVATIATETLSAFTPERTFTSTLLPLGTFLEVNGVVHTLTAQKVRTEVLCSEVRP